MSSDPNLESLHQTVVRIPGHWQGLLLGGVLVSTPALPRAPNPWVVLSREGEPWGWPPHKTHNFVFFLSHTHIGKLTALPSPITSSSQKLQPLSPKHQLTLPPAPHLSPPRSLPPRPPWISGRPHSQSASCSSFSSASFPTRPAIGPPGYRDPAGSRNPPGYRDPPGCLDLPDARPAYRLLQVHNCAAPTQPRPVTRAARQLPGAAEAALRAETQTLTLSSGPCGRGQGSVGSWGEVLKSCVPLN